MRKSGTTVPAISTALSRTLAGAEPLYLMPKDDVAELVISPALAVSENADLMVGFFASQSLAEIAPGLAQYLRKTDEPLRLVVSPFLTAEDQAALRDDPTSREKIASHKLNSGLPDADALASHTLSCLAWLISLGRLQFKIALMREALFHPKVWLFKNGSDVAALHGSANMTGAGLGRNREQLSLARSWGGDEGEHVCRRLEEEFELLWSGGDDSCVVVDLPRAIEEKLLRDYKTERMPTEEEFHRLWRRARGVSDLAEAPISDDMAKAVTFAIPAWLDYRNGDYAHQGEAVDAWRNAGWRGVLEMCTGSGKTLTAMIGAWHLHREVGPLLIVVTAPYNVLVQQWCEEISLFGLRPADLTAVGGPKGRERLISAARRRLRMGITPAEALVVSNDTLVTSEFLAQINEYDGPKLIIADECHNLGAAGFSQNPPEFFDFRLGLSATPVRQYDGEGTQSLFDYFGEPCFSFGLEQAIGRCLTPYDYFVHFVSLGDDEMAEWRDLSDKIARLAWKLDAGIQDDYLNNLFLQRRRVLETARAKIDTLGELLDREDRRALRYTLIYATDKDPSQLEAVNSLLDARDLKFHQLTAEETADRGQTRRILQSFQAGDIQLLTAKRVLDEGVNIPQTERAYILASTTVRRQWVQRRGRLLRMCKEIGKTHAVIHDLVALPPEAYEGGLLDSESRRIVSSELDRVWEFARLSRNAATSHGAFSKAEEMRSLLRGEE